MFKNHFIVDYNDDDYDPFAEDICNDDTEYFSVDSVAVIPNTEHPSYLTPDIVARYPGYSWHLALEDEEDLNFDPGMSILPQSEIITMRCKPSLYKTLKGPKAQIDHDFWEPFNNWIKGLMWTISSKDLSGFEECRAKSCTFIEMCIAFQFDTGYNIIKHNAPLADQVNCFRAGFSRALQSAQMVSNTGTKYRDVFSMTTVCSIRSLTGSDAPGVQRRPILSDETLLHIGKNITLMCDCGGMQEDEPYHLQHFGTEGKKWTPDIILDLQAMVQRRKDEIAAKKEADALTSREAAAAAEQVASSTPTTLSTPRAPSSGGSLNEFQQARKRLYSQIPRVAHASVLVVPPETFSDKRRRLQATLVQVSNEVIIENDDPQPLETGRPGHLARVSSALDEENTTSAVEAALGRSFMRSARTRASSTTTSSSNVCCFFGHTTTTSKVWLRNPVPSFWSGTPSDVPLCYRCYQIGYRMGPIPATDAPT